MYQTNSTVRGSVGVGKLNEDTCNNKFNESFGRYQLIYNEVAKKYEMYNENRQLRTTMKLGDWLAFLG